MRCSHCIFASCYIVDYITTYIYKCSVCTECGVCESGRPLSDAIYLFYGKSAARESIPILSNTSMCLYYAVQTHAIKHQSTGGEAGRKRATNRAYKWEKEASAQFIFKLQWNEMKVWIWKWNEYVQSTMCTLYNVHALCTCRPHCT